MFVSHSKSLTFSLLCRRDRFTLLIYLEVVHGRSFAYYIDTEYRLFRKNIQWGDPMGFNEGIA